MRQLWPISLFWFLYFGGLGVFFPLFSLYLSENAALTGTQVGLVLAVFPLLGLIAQPFWGQVADRTGARSRVLALVTCGAAVGFIALGVVRGFGLIVAAMVLMSAFATAVIPLAVSVSLAALHGKQAGGREFGDVRMWGSVGFLGAVVAFPRLLDHVQARLAPSAPAWQAPSAPPTEPHLEVMFLVTGSLALLAAISALRMPRGGGLSLRAAPGEWRILLRTGPVRRLLVFAFLSFLFIQGPMSQFPVFVRRQLGGDADMVSGLWVLMLLVEIPLIRASGALVGRIGARGLLGLGAFAGAVRWLLCGLTTHMAVLVPAQLLHGVVVTGILLGGPLYLEQVVPPNLRSTAQSIYAMVGIGLGGCVSNLVTGWLLDHSLVTTPYLVGGIGALLLTAIVPWLLPRVDGPGAASASVTVETSPHAS